MLINRLGDLFKKAVSTILNELNRTCQLLVCSDVVNLLGGNMSVSQEGGCCVSKFRGKWCVFMVFPRMGDKTILSETSARVHHTFRRQL